MPKRKNLKNLDVIFEALANPHRREIIHSLSLQPYSITQLGIQRNLSLQAIYKHIKLLKNAQLVQDKKIGRIHFLTLNRATIHILQDWLMQYQTHWGSNKETLENYATFLENSKSRKGVKKK